MTLTIQQKKKHAYIAVLGRPDDMDTSCLERFFSREGYATQYYPDCAAFKNVSDSSLVPAAFFSFFNMKEETLLELFASLPIGTGEKIPFFQYVNGEVQGWLQKFPIAGYFEMPFSEIAFSTIIHYLERNTILLNREALLYDQLATARYELDEIVRIGTALSSEYDLKSLLEQLLNRCRKAVKADAGSIYMRERAVPGGPLTDSLLFMIAQNDSVDTGRSKQFRLPVNKESIAGYVALTGKPLNIANVAEIDQNAPFMTSKDSKYYFHYHVKSMFTIPLINAEHQVVGVLQLINRKKSLHSVLKDLTEIDAQVQHFTDKDERFVLTVAPFAAVLLERAQMYENITALFEGVLNASITSIDERDRVTSGHSRRVMRYAMAFVDAAQSKPDHPFHELCTPPERRRQFQFAALLHDIGKIGVPEFVLTKEQRLPRDEFNVLMANFDYIEMQQSVHPESVSWSNRDEIRDDREFLVRINKCGRIDDTDIVRLDSLRHKWFIDSQGNKIPLLSAYANEALSVTRGNLTAAERELINSHAQSTRRILSMIPWTNALMNVPAIAAQHHERIDGSGYPEGITGDGMFLESRILAVIDIFEALVAQDRPYKPKMPIDAALRVLHNEVADGHLDGDVVDFFVDHNIYRLYCWEEEDADGSGQ